MTKSKTLLMIGIALATITASAGAQTLEVAAVGSSAQYCAESIAAWQILGSGAQHYTFKNGGAIVDGRLGAGVIPNQSGNLSIMWDANATQVYYYLSVDSVVGNRAFFASQLVGGVPVNDTLTLSTLGAPGNLCSTGIWGADAATVPAAVQAVVNNSHFNAAFTDVLPADAAFAEKRTGCNPGAASPKPLGCLGYGYGQTVGGVTFPPVTSSFTGGPAYAVDFNIFGNDPYTSQPVQSYQIVPVGVAPVIFVVNRGNASCLGAPTGAAPFTLTDVTYKASAILLFTGMDLNSTAFVTNPQLPGCPVNAIVREPISGTYNTAEFNWFVTNSLGNVPSLLFSQEGTLQNGGPTPCGIPNAFYPNAPNNLNAGTGACPYAYGAGGQGKKLRATGTGDTVTGLTTTADSVGYLFFSFSNVASIAAQAKYGYLTYAGVDPIDPAGTSAAYTNAGGGLVFNGGGQLPTCTIGSSSNCTLPSAPYSFPNVRSGAYPIWSLLRAVTNPTATDAHGTSILTLTTNVANKMALGTTDLPDFIPFNAAGGDPGATIYRSHFTPSDTVGTPAFNYNATNTPNNGIPPLNPASAEAGGDVGGCMQYKTVPNLLNCRQ